MSTYIITYDLMQAGQNYRCLHEKLNAYPTHWRFQQSAWIIETNQSAMQIGDNLKACLDTNDKLFVARLSGEAAWMGHDATGNTWLQNRLSKVGA